jgi:class 3 adenylate cyclase
VRDAIRRSLRRLRCGKRACCKVCSECGSSLRIGGPTPSVAPAVPGPPPERRQLSVMFCDMVGSTDLSSRLDPEDLSELIRVYQSRITETITRFDGFIAKYMGDRVLAYFGWPRAGEADAEQAVRAALAAVDVISVTPIRGEALRVRIGIATGLVVVGDRIGTGTWFEQTAIGETPNRAARLQALSEPGGIMIDAATRRQLGDLFECRSLGAMPLKGLPATVEVFEVVGERAGHSRFEALRMQQLTPLIGREEELDLLLRRWAQATRGEGRAVLVSGEPGIGKSRLLAALDERLQGETFSRQCYFCSPYKRTRRSIPLSPRSSLHPTSRAWTIRRNGSASYARFWKLPQHRPTI